VREFGKVRPQGARKKGWTVGSCSAAAAHGTAMRPPPATANTDHRARQLDAAQQVRLEQASRDAVLLYPNDPDLQCAAVDAAVEYLQGNASLVDAGAEWRRIRGEEKRHQARVRQLAVMTVADKISSERSVARAVGVERMRLRRWSGKAAVAPAERPRD
jgi:hypothetical protein